MTLAKVSPGQPLRIPAATFNACIDAAAAYQASRTTLQADGGANQPTAGIVTVRNDSGADQDRFAVLGIGTPLILPTANAAAFQERVAMALIAPDADAHADRICILQEPIAAGKLGRGLILGVTPVRLDVQAEDDRVAAVVTGATGTLTTGSTGAARILWKEAGTGVVWGLVQIPSGGASSGSPNLVLEITATTHGWMLGDVLRWSGSGWVLADAAVVGATDMLAVVGKVPDANTALLVLWGICCLDGLTDHTDYWLDPGIPGALTATKPGDTGRLVLHHAANRLCVVRAGGAGSGGSGGAERFADLSDVDVTSTPPTDGQVPGWDAAAQRWMPQDALLPAQAATSVLANATGAEARPTALAADTDGTALLRLSGVLQWARIPTAALDDRAVTSAKLANGSVAAEKLQNDAVTTLSIRDGAVTTAKIAAGAITTALLDHHAVTSDALADGSVSESKLQSDAVSTLSIRDGAVTAAKLAATGVAAGGYGSATQAPVITVDAQGRITAASAVTSTPAWASVTGKPSAFPPAPHSHMLGGDVTGEVTATVVGKLQGKPLAAAVGGVSGASHPALVLWWDIASQAWTPFQLWASSAVTGWVNCYDSAAGTANARSTGVMAGTAQSVFGRANAADGLPAAIPAGEGTALGRGVGGVLGFTATLALGKPGVGGTVGEVTVNAGTGAGSASAWRLSGVANSLAATANGVTVLELKGGSTQQIVLKSSTGTVGATTVQIDWSGTAPRIQLFRTDISTTVPLVDLNLAVSPTGGWTTAKALALREIDICDAGVAKKMLVLASAPYGP